MNAILATALFILTSLTSIAQSTFNVTASGTNAQIDSAIDFTTDIWAARLNSVVPIKINFIYVDLTGAGPLGITFPNGRKDFSQAPEPNLWYASCLANSLEGSEINVGEYDMDIRINSSTNYYFGLDGNPGPGQYDFVSVFLHEICHGLGALSVSKIDAGVGSYGFLDASSTFPLVTSFPFPVLEGLPSIWDYYMVNGAGDRITDTLLYANQSIALGNEFETNDIFFSGPDASSANFGNPPKIYAPFTYADGSSLQHLDENTFSAASGNGLMTPFIGSGEVTHDPGSILMGALQDIGWSTNVVSIGELTLGEKIQLFPNPATNQLTISWKPGNNKATVLKIIDLSGKIILTETGIEGSSTTLNISHLIAGTYIVFCSQLTTIEHAKLVIH